MERVIRRVVDEKKLAEIEAKASKRRSRPMGIGTSHLFYEFDFNGKTYGGFKTQKSAKEKLEMLIGFHEINMDIISKMPEKKVGRLGLDVLGNDMEEVLGIKGL